MAGKIIADTIETGAGANVSTSYVVEGSAKAWLNLAGTGTISVRDSNNISSVSDDATGNYTMSLTNSMNTVNYSVTTSCGRDATNDYYFGFDQCNNYATGSYSHQTGNGAGTSIDHYTIPDAIFGDLA